MKRFLVLLFISSLILSSCGKDKDLSDESADKNPSKSREPVKVATLEECDRYVAFLECLQTNQPEDEEVRVSYEEAILQVRSREPNQAAALCASSMQILEDNKQDVEKYGCQL